MPPTSTTGSADQTEYLRGVLSDALARLAECLAVQGNFAAAPGACAPPRGA